MILQKPQVHIPHFLKYISTSVFAYTIRPIRDEIVPLIGGFPRFWGHFRQFCDFPRSVIKVWGDGGGLL